MGTMVDVSVAEVASLAVGLVDVLVEVEDVLVDVLVVVARNNSVLFLHWYSSREELLRMDKMEDALVELGSSVLSEYSTEVLLPRGSLEGALVGVVGEWVEASVAVERSSSDQNLRSCSSKEELRPPGNSVDELGVVEADEWAEEWAVEERNS
uniref:Uncharacterized protein n=1 Tax=Anopheles atroparvus TaxID=41427 RepID=A0A182JIB5_ANOAO